MDEKNNTINNNDSQNSMNYSFDFANQVDNTVPAQNNVEPETLNVTPTPVQVNEPVNTPQVSAGTLNVDNVSQAPVNTSSVVAQPGQVNEPVNTSAPQVSAETLNVDNVSQAPVNTSSVVSQPVQVNEPVNTSAPQVSATNTVNNTASTQGADVAPVASEVTNTAMPGVTPVVPVTPEMVTAQNKEEENVELIKDKKATKNFLIVLFVLLIAFVIALPIIFNFIG